MLHWCRCDRRFSRRDGRRFLETYHFLNELDISYLHVFTYSERANTLAAEMPDVVPMEERRRRNEMLTILSQKKRRYFYEQFMGETRPVLFEQSKTKGMLSGFTDNYIKIEMPAEENLINEILPVKLMQINADGNMDSSLALSKVFQSL
ncbi:MAG: hypothetical protein R2788_24435 [Saprospiraceae bacterium]